MNNIENKIYQLLSKKINELGFSLVSVKYQKENKVNYLHITLDKEDCVYDISLDEIVHVSDLISPLLDVSDILNEPYVLDVSSLGAEKEIKLDKLDKFVSQYINAHLSNPYKGLNNIIGTLVSIDKENVTMQIRDKSKSKNVVLLRKNIDKVNLAIKF